MADETKKKPAAKKESKEGKPEAAEKVAKSSEEKAPKASAEATAGKGKKPAAADAPAGAADAEAAKPAEGAAPAIAAAPTAAELLADDLAGKKIIKAKGAKNITSGIANILATFNNTLVSITDMQGHVIGWSSA